MQQSAPNGDADVQDWPRRKAAGAGNSQLQAQKVAVFSFHEIGQQAPRGGGTGQGRNVVGQHGEKTRGVFAENRAIFPGKCHGPAPAVGKGCFLQIRPAVEHALAVQIADARNPGGRGDGTSGAIGERVATLASAFGMRVIAVDPKTIRPFPQQVAQSTTLGGPLEESDVVSLHVPLTDATRNMIDAAALALMKRGAILLNTARGGIFDEEALVAQSIRVTSSVQASTHLPKNRTKRPLSWRTATVSCCLRTLRA